MSGRTNEHGELIVDVLRYATRLLAEGDEATLMTMGFSPEHILAIEALTLKSVQRLGALGGHFLDFRIDPVCFARVMKRVEQEREEEALKDALMRAGAPIRMMHHFWGMTSHDCAERRRVLSVEPPVGRPSLPDAATLERLWHLWQELNSIADERRRYLELARKSELSLSAIWTAVEEWQGDIAARQTEQRTASSRESASPGRTRQRVVELQR